MALLNGYRIWLLLASTVTALTPAQWRSQSIYQVITDRFALTNGSTTAPCSLGDYCGGSWQGLINRLDYIQGMGFTAVWISPVVQNLDSQTAYGRPYHGYWAQDIYQLNSHFGTPADLKALSRSLHNRGMYLMVDVVTNHMGFDGGPDSVQYNNLQPFNSRKYYHSYCPIDYNNITSVQQCWAGDSVVVLPDLRTEDVTVQKMWNQWITQLVKNYTIDGLRIDSAMEVNQGFFPSFVSASGVYAVGEVFEGDPDVLCPYQNYMPGVLNYGAYYWVVRAFQSAGASMSELVNGVEWLKSSCKDTTLLGNFLENHDNPRFASLTSDSSLTMNAIAYTQLSDGIPITYYGQEQGFTGTANPGNRQPLWPSGYNTNAPLYGFIKQLNGIRKAVTARDSSYLASNAEVIYSDTTTVVTRKGAPGRRLTSVFTNLGSSGTGSITLNATATTWSANTKFIDLLSCNVFVTDKKGNLVINMKGGLPRALYPVNALGSNSLCGRTQTQGWTTTTTSMKSSSLTLAPTSCSVTFHESATTSWGQSIKIAGSIPQLGNWDSSQALPLSAVGYTEANPTWNLVVDLAPGTSFEYKFINVDGSGRLTWEGGRNRVYRVPTSCSSNIIITSTWQ